MAQATYNEVTFQQALARARDREAQELSLAACGKGPAPSVDIGDMLRRQAREHMQRVLGA